MQLTLEANLVRKLVRPDELLHFLHNTGAFFECHAELEFLLTRTNEDLEFYKECAR